jgi:hypothetical protein
VISLTVPLKQRLKDVRHAGRYPFYYVIVLLPDPITQGDIDAFLGKLKKGATTEKDTNPIVSYKDDQLKTGKIDEIVLSLRFKYDWRAKTSDYSHFYSKAKGSEKTEKPEFIKSVDDIQQILFKEASGLELQIFRHGLIVEKVRVPSMLKRQPGYREALSFSALAPIWTLVLDPLSRAVKNQIKTGTVGFPRLLMKDRDLFPWGDGFSIKESLTNALADYISVASTIEARAVVDKSFEKISQTKSMCLIFSKRAKKFASQLKLGNLPELTRLSHKILELDYESMIALHSTLASIESKIDKIIEDLHSRR